MLSLLLSWLCAKLLYWTTHLYCGSTGNRAPFHFNHNIQFLFSPAAIVIFPVFFVKENDPKWYKLTKYYYRATILFIVKNINIFLNLHIHINYIEIQQDKRLEYNDKRYRLYDMLYGWYFNILMYQIHIFFLSLDLVYISQLNSRHHLLNSVS